MSDTIKVILEQIARGNDGVLTAELVLEHAKSKDSPLHDQFQWDNKSAAHAYRLWQARELIRSVKIEITTETRVIRAVAYVRDPSAKADEQGMVSVLSLRSDQDAAREVLVREFGLAASALRRAQDLAEVFGMKDTVTELTEKLTTMKTQVQNDLGAPNRS